MNVIARMAENRIQENRQMSDIVSTEENEAAEPLNRSPQQNQRTQVSRRRFVTSQIVTILACFSLTFSALLYYIIEVQKKNGENPGSSSIMDILKPSIYSSIKSFFPETLLDSNLTLSNQWDFKSLINRTEILISLAGLILGAAQLNRNP